MIAHDHDDNSSLLLDLLLLAIVTFLLCIYVLPQELEHWGPRGCSVRDYRSFTALDVTPIKTRRSQSTFTTAKRPIRHPQTRPDAQQKLALYK